MQSHSITKHFAKLGAPLADRRKSWGSISLDGSRIFLRVWQHEARQVDGNTEVILTDTTGVTNKAGYRERLDHIEKIRTGTPGYLIFCIPVHRVTGHWSIKEFDQDRIFPVEKLVERDGAVSARCGRPIKLAQLQELERAPED